MAQTPTSPDSGAVDRPLPVNTPNDGSENPPPFGWQERRRETGLSIPSGRVWGSPEAIRLYDRIISFQRSNDRSDLIDDDTLKPQR